MEDYLVESFNHTYDSIILGEYNLTYNVYKVDEVDTGYAIAIVNNLTNEECYLENFKSYNSAVNYIDKIHSLIRHNERNVTDRIYTL